MKRILATCLCLILLTGCGKMSADYSRSASAAKEAAPAANFDATYEFESTADVENGAVAGGEADGGQADKIGAAEARSPAERKIIYTAEISLVVKSFDNVDSQIKKLVKSHGGYIANFQEDASYGDRRSATWTVRVPVAGFDEILDEIADLGVPESRGIDSQDVTEQFVDLNARLKTRRAAEGEMLELLQKRDGDLKDILEISSKLTDLREEIERIEGRLRYLSDRVDLTTITIHIRQEENYVPAQAPTFVARIGQTWNRSLAALQTAGEGIVIFAVAVAPWLVIVCALLAPLVIYLRHRWAMRSSR